MLNLLNQHVDKYVYYACLISEMGPGKGYKLGITTSFTDNNMTITISPITRVSEAIDPF